MAHRPDVPALDRPLRAFLAVARSRSLHEAAASTGVTAAALSRQIGALEATLDTRLFHRTGRGMQLTPAGERMIERLERAYDAIDRVLDEAIATAGDHVSIATVNTLAAYLIPSLLDRIRTRRPSSRIVVTLGSSTEVVALAERGVADLGLVYDVAVDSDELVPTRLHVERLCGYQAVASSLAAETLGAGDLVTMPLILPSRAYALRRIVERECGRPLSPTVESNSIELSLELAARGWGVAILPVHLPEEVAPHGRVRRVALRDGRFERQVVAVARRGAVAEGATACALEACRELTASLN